LTRFSLWEESRSKESGTSRIQFTPDLMPSDITGTDILQEDTGPRAAAS
jgi:MoxR-like ATPase